MAPLSSGSFIRLHALFQFVLAVYLTKLRDLITDEELLYKTDGGRIQLHPHFHVSSFLRPYAPLACSGVLLAIIAIFDLTYGMKLQLFNQLFAIARVVRNSNLRRSHTLGAVVRIIADFMDLYHQVCMLLMLLRISVFFGVAGSILVSPEELWSTTEAPDLGRLAVSARGNGTWTIPDMSLAVERLAPCRDMFEVKTRVIFAYGSMEASFCFWIFKALYDEQRATIRSHQTIDEPIRRFLQEQQFT